MGCGVGDNTAHWSGVVSQRGDKGIWVKVSNRDNKLRQSLEEAGGFSISVGCDVGDNTAHWFGVVSQLGDKGIWVKVRKGNKLM